MSKAVIGILAHVDAGKTTLSEALLYTSKNIKELGRVDKGNAFLDNDETERKRGITIYSKTATLSYEGLDLILLDTPGHADFSPEMERTLSVLDYCILVIDGSQRLNEYTRLQYNLLKEYRIPTFVFVNKWDRAVTNKETFVKMLKEFFKGEFVCFSEAGSKDKTDLETVASLREDLLEEYLVTETLGDDKISSAINELLFCPCYFGSGLKLTGIEEFLNGLKRFITNKVYCEISSAKIYKINYGEDGVRLSFAKITGGSFRIKDEINGEKLNQIRVYSGGKYVNVTEVNAGDICAFTGLLETYAGQVIGFGEEEKKPVILPVMNYVVESEEKIDVHELYGKLKRLAEEEPSLMLSFDENTSEIRVSLMGEIQRQIILEQIEKRFGVKVSFGKGTIAYKETITEETYGVGHFEPLRHYAEVHVLIEPIDSPKVSKNNTIEVYSDLSEDVLDKNWQKLIINNLRRFHHKGVLIGSELTNVKITLKNGKAHNKHSQTTDFRQAGVRAVRQGLMYGKSRLLEPYYNYSLIVPQYMMGKAMTDMENRLASVNIENMSENPDDMCLLTGMGPVSTLWDYAADVWAYTKGKGTINLEYAGYGECHNEEDVINKFGYVPENDMANPCGSVFCAHGAGYNVEWDRVFDLMHLENAMDNKPKITQEIALSEVNDKVNLTDSLEAIGTDEIELILNKTFNANKKADNKNVSSYKKHRTNYYGQDNTDNTKRSSVTVNRDNQKEKYLLVDGYNVIFAWDELKILARENLDGARGKLLDVLCDYAGTGNEKLIVVFDAYKTNNPKERIDEYYNINVVYTKQAQTADAYIEKFTHDNKGKYNITVATSDGLEQLIIRGAGCNLVSAREFHELVEERRKRLSQEDFYSDGESIGNKVL